MRLALAQINTTVGDLAGNRERIVGRMEEAKEAWKTGHATNKFNPWGKRCAEVLAAIEAGGQPPR